MDPKFILDACCSGRMFWFNKNHPNVIYADIRKEAPGICKERPNFEVNPDVLMDFRKMNFPDKRFKLVVWDPPHLKTLGPNGILAKKYGKLNEKWEDDLAAGFKECWRVLEDFGVLIFKWNEFEFKTKAVLELFEEVPLFGHTIKSRSKTKWMCFMKIPKLNNQEVQMEEPIPTQDNTTFVISRAERPSHYECGKAGDRHKIYYNDTADLKDQVKALKEAGFMSE